MFIKTFKVDVIVGNVLNVFDVTLTDNFQYQSVLDPDNITLWDQRKNVQITNNFFYSIVNLFIFQHTFIIWLVL